MFSGTQNPPPFGGKTFIFPAGDGFSSRSFIFSDNTYTIESFANELGGLAIEGINLLGDMEFAVIKTNNQELSGIKLTIKTL